MVIAIVIVAVLVVYFAFYAGKGSGFEEEVSQPEDIALADTQVVASLREKYIAPGGRVRASLWAVFACDDGVVREFMLQKEIFDELYIGQRDTLIYSGAIFLGFGPYGGTDIEGDEADSIPYIGEFSQDDFDESIDIEQSIDLTNGADDDALGAEDREALAQFRDYVKLPTKVETITDRTDSVEKYKTENLLQKVTVYPFLKREAQIGRMFERTYSDAVDDMLGYAGHSRQGQAADSVLINGSEIRLVITVQELTPPLQSTITAEFGVND